MAALPENSPAGECGGGFGGVPPAHSAPVPAVLLRPSAVVTDRLRSENIGGECLQEAMMCVLVGDNESVPSRTIY